MNPLDDNLGVDDALDPTYAEPTEQLEEAINDEPGQPEYLRPEDLDARFNAFAETLMERLSQNMANGAPNPGLAPTQPETPFADDEYARAIYERAAEDGYQRARQELDATYRPMLTNVAQQGLMQGLEPAVAQEFQNILALDPNAALIAQQNPQLAALMRDAAETRARRANVPASPPSGRTYNPSQPAGPAYDPDQAAAADAVFSDMPGYQGFGAYAQTMRGGRR